MHNNLGRLVLVETFYTIGNIFVTTHSVTHPLYINLVKQEAAEAEELMAKIKARHKERSDMQSLSTHRSRQFDDMVCHARLSPSRELVGVYSNSV